MLSKLTSAKLPTITTFICTIPVLFTFYIAFGRFFRLFNNYRLVRNLSPTVPIIIAPWTWQDPLWIVLAPRLVPVLRNLPGFRSWIWCSYMGWTTEDQGRAHLPVSLNGRGLGPAFVLVSPSRTEFFTTDPAVAVEVARDWKTWAKPRDLYAVFEVFGTNVNTVNGENGEWQRHRKITGGAFTRDATLSLVWQEATTRAGRLMQRLLEGDRSGGQEGPKGELTMAQVRDEMSLLTMHVLSVAAFGHGHNDNAHAADKEPNAAEAEKGTQVDSGSASAFASARPPQARRSTTTDSLTTVSATHRLSYFECIQQIFPNLISVVLVGTINFPSWILPKSISNVKLAVDEYRLYLQEALSRIQDFKGAEKDHGNGTGKGTDLASMLINANEAEKALQDGKGAAGQGIKSYLTESELYGNVFMINIAGFETTSMALSFAMPYLALNPDLWDWIKEEVDAVVGDVGGVEDYENVFERLVRCRALMYESLRLHHAVAHLPRQSPPSTTTLDIPHPHSSSFPPSTLLPSSKPSAKATNGRGDTTTTTTNNTNNTDNNTLSLPIPPNSLVSIPIVIMGLLPNLFPEPYVFDPRRFLASTTSTTPGSHSHRHTKPGSNHHSTSPAPPSALPPLHAPLLSSSPSPAAGHEVLIPEKQLALHGFQPWISGPRVCPGRKFSQVEFVAVIVEMVRRGVRVGLRRSGGDEAAREAEEAKALGRATRECVFNLGTRMVREAEVGVRFYREEEERGERGV